MFKVTMYPASCQDKGNGCRSSIGRVVIVEHEDNIYYVAERIKLLSKSSKLFLNPELFSSHLLTEIREIHKTLMKLSESLGSSMNTKDHQSRFRSQMLAHQAFDSALSDLSGSGMVNPRVIGGLGDIHKKATLQIQNQLENSSLNETTEVTSNQETKLLFGTNEE